jgi:uncharacterized protein (DUF3084 family)
MAHESEAGFEVAADQREVDVEVRASALQQTDDAVARRVSAVRAREMDVAARERAADARDAVADLRAADLDRRHAVLDQREHAAGQRDADGVRARLEQCRVDLEVSISNARLQMPQPLAATSPV